MLRFELHTLGWFSFEELCRTILREEWGQPVEAYSRGPDGGRDGFLFGPWHGTSEATVVQCKHSGSSDARLHPSDLRDDLRKIAVHAADGRCDRYVLMTNAAVTGDTAAIIEGEFRAVGVSHTIVQGYEAICEMLTANASLRALVPRLYGLGDLTEILDERSYQQAQAILAAMHDDLAVLVPVEAHRAAYRALKDHGFALLLGRPGSGKSSIAASLMVSGMDQHGARPIKLSSIAEFPDRWNPREPNQLFWLDDAFGATQYEHVEAQEWNRAARPLRAALERGARVIATSRDYIYAAAKADLKRGDFPLLTEAQVVIEVESFTRLEREQILYNHLKLGRQPPEVLKRISPSDLEAFAADPAFLPELARRLADPSFTKRVWFNHRPSLLNFCRRPKELLLELLENLDDASRAALGLVHINGNRLASPYQDSPRDRTFLARLDVSLGSALRGLETLEGSFLRLVTADGSRWWQFQHPTLANAYESWLADRPELLAEFVASSDVSELLRTVTCGDLAIEGAIVLPRSLYEEVANRIVDARPFDANGSLWGWDSLRSSFLARRCDQEFLEVITTREPQLIDRVFDIGLYLDAYRHRIPLARRLLSLGLAGETQRRHLVTTLIEYAAEGIDGSFLSDDDWLSFFHEEELQELDDAVMVGLEHLDEAIDEHLRESKGDVDTAKSSIGGYSARYPDHPGVEAAENALSAFVSWEPDADALDRWADAPNEAEAEPTSVHAPQPSGPSVFDDLAPPDDLAP